MSWRMPAEKSPFQAAHGSCQHHSGKETCWYPPPCSLLPSPCQSSSSSSSTCLRGCTPLPPHHCQPHSALLHSRTGSSSSLLLLLPKVFRCPAVCCNQPTHTLAASLAPGAMGGEFPDLQPCPGRQHARHTWGQTLPPLGRGHCTEPTPAAPKGPDQGWAHWSWGGWSTEVQPQMFPPTHVEDTWRTMCARGMLLGCAPPKAAQPSQYSQHERVAERMVLI